MTVRRLRRLRGSPGIRALMAETRLDPARFVLPIFVSESAREPEPLPSMPGHFYWPADQVAVLAKQAESLGIAGILVFGVTERKDAKGTRAAAADGPAQRAIAEIKSATPGMVVFADTCLCGYTCSGHCGIVQEGEVLNDPSCEALAAVALSQARAGADFAAPSDMMDGRVAAIRAALDGAGLTGTGIMSYSAKFASSMYGPFREVAGSAPSLGDRTSYQIDPSAHRQALASVERDLAEGADIIMVKPALVNLDLIAAVRARFDAPVSAYNVSGEYAMVKAASQRGWMDEQRAALEILGAIVRSGAQFVITYHALDAARWLAEG
ncbi:MAG: porphobilinogen synthase [Actinomycetota bacterium]